ncbi:MAG: amidohydrolase family protein [Nitrospinae bacterium]|nr:amidohydrolase family protein [Nitrospinota bacterium]
MPDMLPCPPPDPHPRAPRFKLPPGAWDTHGHIFGPESRYAYSPRRGYTPPDALLDAYGALHRTLGVSRGVLTQPSVYGVDNTAMLDAMARSGGRLMGVASVDKEVSEAELTRLHDAGVRGLRINLADKGGNPFASFADVQTMGERIEDMGWHMEFLIHVHEFPDLRKTFSSLPVHSVFGHMGYVPAPEGLDPLREFMDLLKEGRTWVKLTGAYRITGLRQTPYSDVDPVAQALIEAAPERIIWGTDWPHPVCKIPMPNDGDLLDQLLDWAPNESVRERILVENPLKLLGIER